MKTKVIAVVGPTASGKSDLAVKIALYLKRKTGIAGEVISADSRQVYRGLDLGTGKITAVEMRGIKHHILDVAGARKKSYTVSDYQRDAAKCIAEISSRGAIPIICGGTGFYIDAVLKNIVLPNVEPDFKLRARLETLEKKSPGAVYKMLLKMDSRRAKAIGEHNIVRLIRAIEIASALGKVPVLDSAKIAKSKSKIYDTLLIGIGKDYETLKKRISKRLASRMASGMLNEAKKLHTTGLSWKKMEALGLEYRYMARFLQKKISRDEMVTELEKEICHYAKRQMTWFGRDKNIKWFENATKALVYVKSQNKFLKNPLKMLG